jgi:hypothetical protein
MTTTRTWQTCMKHHNDHMSHHVSFAGSTHMYSLTVPQVMFHMLFRM